ncbi:SDR family oxidoreductase [Sporolactobacillus sp. Y61]|jgi:3-oxoacyl-[acyl-carrier protein] reductase|uniref:SDR family oxidoreductase n=1 Tax=Sporolactobacillus sp. Y61 TaxID=3160863 RepID=A0AAU8ICK2_9BACL|nr:SDR family oxidoreductase [Sporolactobacillus sp. THM19-2]RYL92256.1 SDR family oxidoreductase [Sporolactobacillus sp. THM19-2]
MRNILITGASGSIGQAVAGRIAMSGASLYLHYCTGVDRIQKLSGKLRNKFPEQFFTCVQADLADENGPDKLLHQLDQQVDGVIYTSGQSQVGLFQDVPLKSVQQQIQLQLISPFRIIQSLIQPMIREKQGKIVIVSSIWGLTGASTEVLYSMVKGGQNTFVKALAKEVAPSGISVNAVAPGAVDTPMMDEFSKQDIALVKEDIPMDRLAEPEEVASLVAFLMRPESSYISGQVISINGAWYC